MYIGIPSVESVTAPIANTTSYMLTHKSTEYYYFLPSFLYVVFCLTLAFDTNIKLVNMICIFIIGISKYRNALNLESLV